MPPGKGYQWDCGEVALCAGRVVTALFGLSQGTTMDTTRQLTYLADAPLEDDYRRD